MSAQGSSPASVHQPRRVGSGARAGSSVVAISLVEITEEAVGGGGYAINGGQEAGLFGFLNAGQVSLGVGGGVSSNGGVDVFGFLSVEARTGFIGVSENAVVLGYSADSQSSGAYLGQINARGYEIGALGQDVTAVSGTETVTPIHPLDALMNTLDNVLGKTVKSVIGPLADPANFGDPTQPASPRRQP
jgi:hypothetical protein